MSFVSQHNVKKRAKTERQWAGRHTTKFFTLLSQGVNNDDYLGCNQHQHMQDEKTKNTNTHKGIEVIYQESCSGNGICW